MKIETKTDIYNTIEIEQVLYHLELPIISVGLVYSEDPSSKTIKMPENRVDSKIFTDGEIVEIIASNPEPINEYKIGNCKYDMPVDTLIKEKVHIKNASYILVMTIAKETLKIGKRGFGWTPVIKNWEIFLNNKKDKQALLTVKNTLMAVTGSSQPETVFEAMFRNPNESNCGLEYDTVTKNVYQLRKVNK